MSFSDIQSGASRAAKSVGGFLGGAAEFAWGTAKLVSALAVEVPVKALYAHRDDITKTAASVGSAAKRSLNELRIDVTNPFSSDGKKRYSTRRHSSSCFAKVRQSTIIATDPTAFANRDARGHYD